MSPKYALSTAAAAASVAALLFCCFSCTTGAFKVAPSFSTRVVKGHTVFPPTPTFSEPSSPITREGVALPTKLHMVEGVGALMQAAPYITAFVTGGLKSSAADLISQKKELRRRQGVKKQSFTLYNESLMLRDYYSNGASAVAKPSIDFRRNFSFTMYGGLCLGVAYEWLYNVLFPKLFGTSTTLSAAVAKTSAEVFFVAPLLSIPISYVLNAFVYRTSFRQALGKYWRDVVDNKLLTTYCAVFGPFQVALFTLVPPHMRMTITSAVSFVWLMILSKISSGKQDEQQMATVPVAVAA